MLISDHRLFNWNTDWSSNYFELRQQPLPNISKQSALSHGTPEGVRGYFDDRRL